MEAVSHNEFMYATSPDPPPPVRGSGTETSQNITIKVELTECWRIWYHSQCDRLALHVN